MQDIAEKIISELRCFDPIVKQATTGSIYIELKGSKVLEIRISNHSGHKLKRNVWEVRSDAMTKRSKFNRVYNVKSLSQMIKDLKYVNSKKEVK